jgi:hypothetical protein
MPGNLILGRASTEVIHVEAVKYRSNHFKFNVQHPHCRMFQFLQKVSIF